MDMQGIDLTDSVVAAKNLLGWKLIHESPEGITSGYIVETEAYHEADPASHAFAGLTTRNAPMFEAAGTIYVYFTYGMHYCMNIVSGEMGTGEGVLIRALEPVEGIELMRKRRGDVPDQQLANGPAKLTQAMGVGKSFSGTRIDKGPMRLEPGIKPSSVITTTRIGIKRAADEPLRFYIEDNRFISKR